MVLKGVKGKGAQLFLLSHLQRVAMSNVYSSVHVSSVRATVVLNGDFSKEIRASALFLGRLKTFTLMSLNSVPCGFWGTWWEKCEARWDSQLLIRSKKTSSPCLPWQWEPGVSQSSESGRWCSDRSSENSPGPLEHLPAGCLYSPEPSLPGGKEEQRHWIPALCQGAEGWRHKLALLTISIAMLTFRLS